ncbi:hypothetical protein RBSH_03189 [Rhodopirellula baltica SH28]|uniref:Uncharacterized protein n=1 Tax=Rhodopirellula baltica SH28 TaxID=993517 RepID=K5DGE6_RHOBT|nr:hypothetical protein RBSH_03189 [Rhodopirellula baltica SH28]
MSPRSPEYPEELGGRPTWIGLITVTEASMANARRCPILRAVAG